MKPYYQDERCTIYHGDCREVMPKLEHQMVDLYLSDPPYGMGKQKEGVANDNFYGAKLDAFLMECWNASRPALKNNASAYIWGNPQDLFRLFYLGGLSMSETLTFRNLIIWNKGPSAGPGGSPVGNADMRCFAKAYESCLFFMLGEQKLNNNAANFFDGFAPIRRYLVEEKEKSGLTNERIREATSTFHTHYWSKSQWAFPTKKDYEQIRLLSGCNAFHREYEDLKREYEDLKREWYASRSYFDNVHELMTDVWDYPRVIGGERFGHPTPKPVAMMRRIIRSSCPEGGMVLDCFMGTGPTLVGAKLEGRKAIGIDLNERYCEIAAKRLAQGVLF